MHTFAGKTSALQVLAGVLPHTRGLQLRGEMGGSCFTNKERERAAFVGQEDRFHSQLTVSETLSVAAQLRLPTVSRLQRRRVVEDLLRQLHLSHIRQVVFRQHAPLKYRAFSDFVLRWKVGHTRSVLRSESRVGDERNRGISGGERRRLALGCELVGRY